MSPTVIVLMTIMGVAVATMRIACRDELCGLNIYHADVVLIRGTHIRYTYSLFNYLISYLVAMVNV